MSMEVEEDVVKDLQVKNEWMAKEMGPDRHNNPPSPPEKVPPELQPVGPPAVTSDLGPIGPWAFGRTEWNPTSGLTGVRRVVDRHSVTLLSPADWARQLDELIAGATRARHRSDRMASSARHVRRRTAADMDALHRESSDHIQQRAQDVWRWQAELRRANEVLWSEIQQLREVPGRLSRVLSAVSRAQHVASECIAVRCRRPDTDLVRDPPHEELMKESSLAREVSCLVSRCLAQAREQLAADRAALSALQADWACKADCYRVDTLARAITAQQQPLTATFQPGAVMQPDGQVTPGSWERATRENISRAEEERARSVAFRALLQPLLDDAVRDIRAHAARVDNALAANVALLVSAVDDLDAQYKQTVQREAATEIVMAELRVAVRATDPNLKTAQSRLQTRRARVPQEDCRDNPQEALLVEVARVNTASTALQGEVRGAVDALHEIREERARLEAVLVLKRRALHLDRDRVLPLREHFPSAAALSGLD